MMKASLWMPWSSDSGCVVMLTGHASLQDADESMQLGAFRYVMKPVSIDDLIGTLREASEQNRDDKQ